MKALRHFAIAATVIAGSLAIVSSPAGANPGIRGHLAELNARGTSRESSVEVVPFVRHDNARGIEIAGDAGAVSRSRTESTVDIRERLAVLESRGSSRESQVGTSPLVNRGDRSRGVEIAGDPAAISESRRDGSRGSLLNRLSGLRSTSRESSARF